MTTIENNIAIAESYYVAMGEKNLAGIEKLLHPEVQLIGPLRELSGKEPFLEAVKGYMGALKTLKINAKFGSGDQVMLTYDVEFPEPMGNLRTAVLLNLHNGLITRLELFFDASLFRKAS